MFAYGGSGSAALATQSKGHPNAAEQQEIADKIYEFLKEKDLIQTGE
jgi:lysophospholipase L1-like esterase